MLEYVHVNVFPGRGLGGEVRSSGAGGTGSSELLTCVLGTELS